jgi:hypothetical protein
VRCCAFAPECQAPSDRRRPETERLGSFLPGLSRRCRPNPRQTDAWSRPPEVFSAVAVPPSSITSQASLSRTNIRRRAAGCKALPVTKNSSRSGPGPTPRLNPPAAECRHPANSGIDSRTHDPLALAGLAVARRGIESRYALCERRRHARVDGIGGRFCKSKPASLFWAWRLRTACD